MPNVLVFESDPEFANELKEGLLQQGCTATVVGDATEGLQVAANQTPDLILLTVELPRVNGFSVCNKLKRDPNLSGVPLIILSSDSSEDTFNQHRRLKNSRAQDYVHKPVAFPELLPRIANLVALPGADAGSVPEAIPVSEDVVHIDEETYLDLDEELVEIEELEELEGPELVGDSVDAEVDEFTEAAFDNLLDDVGPGATQDEFDTDEPAVETEVSQDVERLIGAERATSEDHTGNEGPATVALIDDASLVAREGVAGGSMPAARAEPTVVDSEIPAAMAAPTLPPPSQPAKRLSESEALAALDPQALVEREAEFVEVEARLNGQLDKMRETVERVESAAEVSASQVLALDEQKSKFQDELAMAMLALKQAEERQKQLESQLEGAQSERSGAGSAQEFLAIREQLNSKDKEILELHTQVGHKTRELLAARESGLKFERERGELDIELRELEGKHQELNHLQEVTHADKEQAAKRAEDFKRRSEKLSVELDEKNQAVEDQRLELADAEQRHQVESREALTAAEGKLTAALETRRLAEEQAQTIAQEEWRVSAERAQSTALEHQESRLKTEYEQAFAQLTAEQAVAHKNLQDEADSKLLAAEQQTTAATEQAAALAEKLEQLQTQQAETEANRAATALELDREKEQHQGVARRAEETQAELTAAQEAQVQAQAQIESTGQELSAAQQSLRQAGEQSAGLEQELQGAKERLERLEQEQVTLQAQNERLDQDLSEAGVRSERQGQELAAAQASVSQREQELSAAQERIEAEEAAVARLTEELSASATAVAQEQESLQRDRQTVERGREALTTALECLEQVAKATASP